MKEPALLLIGGLDPTGQAGLARDLAQCERERLRGCPVATALTVQTSQSFTASNAVPAALVSAQAEAALDEHAIRYAKVGLLCNAEQVRAVADLADRHGFLLVLDPVLASSSGAQFLDGPGVDALRDQLLPRAHLVTPNQEEARILLGKDGSGQAEALVDQGAGAALVTAGGHGADVYFDGTHHEFPVTLQAGRHRGTGCRLATRTSALLARDLPRREAVALAHRELQRELALDAAEQALDPLRRAHLDELAAWMPRLLAELRHEHIPEVGMNVAYALRGASDPRRDVAGLAGRITIAGFDRDVAGRLAIGGPHHTGRIAVVLQDHDPEARIVLNHRYDPAFLQAAAAGGLVAVGFRRDDEPVDAPSTMEWGIRNAICRNDGRVPDLVWDEGGPGKEAMIRVVARDPDDLLRKLRVLHSQVA